MLTSTLHQLKINALDELGLYSVNTLRVLLDEIQLETLNNALRSYLYRQNILPEKFNSLAWRKLPIETLKLEKSLETELKSANVKDLWGFLQYDRAGRLNAGWSRHLQLAARTRILYLLTLSAEQLAQTLAVADFREFDFPPSIHQLWLNDWIPPDFSYPLPDIVQYLFEDVYQLPIITSRRHEVWLGAQMRAAQRLDKIIQTSEGKADLVFETVYRQLDETWQRLETLCADNNAPMPNCATWGNEITGVRKSFHTVAHSRFRSFVNAIQRIEIEQTTQQELLNAACNAYELLWLLPGSILGFVRKQGLKLQGSCPAPREYIEWVQDSGADLASSLLRLQKQGSAAKNRLVKGYFRSVLRFARKYIEDETDLDYLDLVQEGAVGLLKAADRYDYRGKARFIQYAVNWIWQTTERAISDQSRNIRLPVHLQEKFKQLEAAYEACLDDGLTPTAKTLCLRLNLLDDKDVAKIQNYLANGVKLSQKIQKRWDQATQRVKNLLTYIEATISLSTEIPSWMVRDEEAEGIALFEILYDQHQTSLEDQFAAQTMPNSIRALLEELPARDQKAIDLRWGLTDGEEHTLEEVGRRFGLTRERIRQLEAKTFEWFQKPVVKKSALRHYLISDGVKPPQFPGKIIGFINERHSYWSKFNPLEAPTKQDYRRLDDLIQKLPGSKWHQRSGQGARKFQVEDALLALQSPAHYSDISEQLNDILGNETLDESYVYNILNSYNDLFILLGEGVFSLTRWEKERGQEKTPTLPFCPLPLPDQAGQTDTFLESILVANTYLKQNPPTSDFLTYMLQWTGEESSASNWFKQSVLNAYYLVGLIPYTFHFKGKEAALRSDLPALGLPEIRHYCLQSLTERLAAMPIFWWIVQRYEPGGVSDFARYFVESHPLELDDVANRLKLLTGLGAMQRLPYGRYQLTSLGRSCAGRWVRQPDFSDEEFVSMAQDSVDEELDIFDWDLW